MLFNTVTGEVGANHELVDSIVPGAEGLDLSDPFHLEMGNIKAAESKEAADPKEAKQNRVALLLLKADYLDPYRQNSEMGSRRFHAILREAQVISSELNGIENTRTNLNLYQDFVEKETRTTSTVTEGEYIPAEQPKKAVKK